MSGRGQVGRKKGRRVYTREFKEDPTLHAAVSLLDRADRLTLRRTFPLDVGGKKAASWAANSLEIAASNCGWFSFTLST